MGSILMNNNINEKIIEKINEIPKNNIQDFLKEALELEYEVRDQEKPHIGNKYRDLINKYYSDNNDS